MRYAVTTFKMNKLSETNSAEVTKLALLVCVVRPVHFTKTGTMVETQTSCILFFSGHLSS